MRCLRCRKLPLPVVLRNPAACRCFRFAAPRSPAAVERHFGLRLRRKLTVPTMIDEALPAGCGSLRLDGGSISRRPVTGLMTQARIVMADIRARHRHSAHHRPWAAHGCLAVPIALDHGKGCIDAVDDDGNAGATGNYDVETVGAMRRPRRSDQNRQCESRSAHSFSGSGFQPAS